MMLFPLPHTCQSSVCWLPVAAHLIAGAQSVALTEACPECRFRYVQHFCSVTGMPSLVPVIRQAPPPWLPILEATVRATCPSCNLVMDLADTVANDPAATKQEKETAEAFKTGVLAVGVALLGVAAINWVAENPPSARTM
jgi:hypothetical protein